MVAMLTVSTASSQQTGGERPPPPTLEQLSDYLMDISTGWTRFKQLNVNGSLSSGVILMSRPGKVRLEYDAPNTTLLIATKWRVAIFDTKSNMAPTIIPTRSTPFRYFLSDEIDLSDPDFLVDYLASGNTTQVMLKSPSPDLSGHVVLHFSNDPVEIVGWTFYDRFNQPTRVFLEGFNPGIAIEDTLFDIDAEIRSRSN